MLITSVIKLLFKINYISNPVDAAQHVLRERIILLNTFTGYKNLRINTF